MANTQTKANGATPVPPVVLVASDPTAESPRVQEYLSPSVTPFDQEAHDLLQKSIDQVATDWAVELQRHRKNNEQVEQMVLKRATKVKSDITALYLLGAAAMAEAKRCDEFNAKLADELDRLAEPGEA